MRETRKRRDVHGLTPEGMLACNPRDREAAHRAGMGDVVVADVSAVTCRTCLARLHRERRKARTRR